MGPVWNDEDNPHISHILNYLCLVACYLKSKEEAAVFKERWKEIETLLEAGADIQDWHGLGRMTIDHCEQALREESVHNPHCTENVGIVFFYENTFERLYEDAKKEYDSFQATQENKVSSMRQHWEEVHSSQENWEAALRRGDTAALCD